MAISEITDNLNIIQSLADKPTQDANELKIQFDKAGNIIKAYINGTLIPDINAEIKANKVSLENSLTSTSTSKALTALQGKNLKDLVDAKQKKITKGTSTPSGGSDGDIYIQYF